MKYYDEISKSYEELHKEEQLKKIRIIKKHLKKPYGILLDIGAGTGISTKPFVKDSIIAIALDPSKKMLEKYKGAKEEGKAESLPFKDNTFDTIISVTALHHTDLKQAIKEIYRVAKPKAQIAISFLKKSRKLSEAKKLLKKFKQIEEEKDIIFIK